MSTKYWVTASLVAMLSAPTAAVGVSVEYSWQGNDRSWNSRSGHTIYAYDGENDGNEAEAQWFRTGSGSRYLTKDYYGNGSTSTYTSGVIYKHRIVELQWTDAVGEWQYPS